MNFVVCDSHNSYHRALTLASSTCLWGISASYLPPSDLASGKPILTSLTSMSLFLSTSSLSLTVFIISLILFRCSDICTKYKSVLFCCLFLCLLQKSYLSCVPFQNLENWWLFEFILVKFALCISYGSPKKQKYMCVSVHTHVHTHTRMELVYAIIEPGKSKSTVWAAA